MKTAIYAGTFDPLTLGHQDVAERAARVFDRLVLAVAEMPAKRVMFDTAERVALARESLKHLSNVEVKPFGGLLVDWARAQGIPTIVRGLRAFQDFEYEFQMALTNRKLAPDIETFFLMPNQDYSYVSSSMVREIAALHGAVERFVPAPVAKALRERCG
ncbi:MAG: pantetheine-phosphate adenylyltransferase [Kiritimatiellae bacterium]|nr:pantetheine-phosphate adenylyltransferase [Kiritimatiellia bacterium]